MSASASPAPSHPPAICGLDPVVLLDLALEPPPESDAEKSPARLSIAEVSLMLPAFEIKRCLDCGGMGAVYEAWQPDLKRTVAIKILSPQLANAPGQAARFRHEAQLMANLHHPGIVQVFDSGESAEGNLYYVMEFVDGENLATRMQHSRLAVAEAVSLLEQISSALQAAHAVGIIHRDIKPANVLLPKNGGVKLGDFGLALQASQSADSPRLTRAGSAVGTVEYAAPEQLSKGYPITTASDVYGLGVLAYELFTGELPRGRFDPPSLKNPAVDAAFDGVVLRALESAPERRFLNAGAFCQALLQAADRPRQQALRDRALHQKLLRKARASVLFGALSIIAIGAAVYGWQQRSLATREAQQATLARQDSEAMVSFLIHDLGDQLEDIGRLDLLEKSLGQVTAYFTRKQGQELDDAALLNQANFYRTLMILHSQRGRWPETNQAGLALLQCWLSLTQRHPQNAEYRQKCARAHFLYGHQQAIQGEPKRALTYHEEARRIISGGKLQAPTDRTDLLIWITATRHVATSFLDQKKLAEAEETIVIAYKLARQAILTNDLVTPKLLMELGTIESVRGSLAERKPDLVAMQEHFESSLAYYRQSDPGVWDYQHQYALCGALARVATAEMHVGKFTEAVQTGQEAVKIIDNLTVQAPGSTSALAQLRHVASILSQSYEKLGNATEAQAWSAQANAAKTRLEQFMQRK
jgi:serine/threonine protein kinase